MAQTRSMYPLRLPDELKSEVERLAKVSGRSMNAEMCMRIQNSINPGLFERPDTMSSTKCSTSIHEALDVIEESGIVIVGREQIEGIAAKDDRETTQLIAFLLSVGPSYGIFFQKDHAKYDRANFASRLGKLGFDTDSAQVVITNLRPMPTPDLVSLSD